MTLNLDAARAWYQGADTVHDFSHIERVYHLATRIAIAESADVAIVQAAVLLHDAQAGTPGGEERAGHHIQSALFAGDVLSKNGWPEHRIQAVQHCIRAHRFRNGWEKPETIEAWVLFDADKLDALGAIGLARAYAYGALLGQPLYAEPSQRFRQSGEYEPGEKHTPCHEYVFKLSKIKALLFTATAQKIAEERDDFLRQYFIRLGRELRGEC